MMIRKSKLVGMAMAVLLFFPCPIFAQAQKSSKSTPSQSSVGSVLQKKEDAELLARALDYFVSKKYHESLILLEQLDKTYRLNPRYKAYLGVCYYYEWEYGRAMECLDPAIPLLVNFAPQERSYYCWIDGESHFALQKYETAIPFYEQMLALCQDYEKADALYRLGFCHLFKAKDGERRMNREGVNAEYVMARDCLRKALDGYLKYQKGKEKKARIAQIQNMLRGME